MKRYFLSPRRLLPALAALLLAACGGGAPEEEGLSTLEQLRHAGVVRVGYANEAPYAFVDQASGRVTGEAPEVIRRVMARLGVPRVEGVLTEFGALIPGLKAGRFDLIAAGMYVTPARCREIAFSDPTYAIGEGFMVRAGNPLGLHGYADAAAHPGARLGVVAGTVELGYAKALGIPMERITVLPDNPAAVAALQAGRIDAFAGTRLTVDDLLAKAGADGGLEAATPFTQPQIEGHTVVGYGAFGLRREEGELLAALNRELAAFIGSDEHLQLVAPFGFGEATLPGGKRAAELCAG